MLVQQASQKDMVLTLFLVIIIKYMHTLIIHLICGEIVKRLSCQVIMTVMEAKSIHTTVFLRKPAILSVKTVTDHSSVTHPGHFRMGDIPFHKRIRFGKSTKTNDGQIRLRLQQP